MQVQHILFGLDTSQKHIHGIRFAEAVMALGKELSLEVVVQLAASVLKTSRELGQLLAERPAALAERSDFTSLKVTRDRYRDEAAMGIDSLLWAFEYRRDRPDVKAAAEAVRRALLADGTGFIRESYGVESSRIDSLLKRAAEPEVKAQIDAVPELAGFIEYLRACEQSFLEAASGKSEAHADAKNAGAALSTLEKRWVSSVRSLVCYLETLPEAPKFDAALQPLRDAAAQARSRATRAASAKEDKAAKSTENP